MMKVEKTSTGEKIATFKNVDSGEIIHHPFNHTCINPNSVPHKELVDAGITDDTGLVDVNPFTL
jgi:hypothetical protein